MRVKEGPQKILLHSMLFGLPLSASPPSPAPHRADYKWQRRVFSGETFRRPEMDASSDVIFDDK